MANHKWKVDVLLQGNWRGASSVLLTGGEEPVLVDTGMPHDAHQLVNALERRGLRPDDIHVLINTHFHLDHVSNNCLFPSSIIYATQESFDWCRALYADMLNDAGLQDRVLKYYPELYDYDNAEYLLGKIRKIELRWWDLSRIGAPAQFRWLEQHPLPYGIETLMTSGHAPGHASIVIRNGCDTTVIAADALVTRTHDDQVLTMIPQNRAQYMRDRETILALRGAVIPGHDQPFMNPGKTETEGK
ncbi:MAG: MBL fold metallo-hydrolase [Terriglobia bacterium]